MRQSLLKKAPLSNTSTPVESSPPVQRETVPITLPIVVTEASGSASVSQPDSRSNPPQEVRSNPSQATEVGRTNATTYSQDVNSTASPSEEYQLPGVSKLWC